MIKTRQAGCGSQCTTQRCSGIWIRDLLPPLRFVRSTIATVVPPEYEPWKPLSLADTIETFRGASFRWWISGGFALELHLGRSWRNHDDTDVSLARGDVPKLRSVLDGWDIHVAAAGQLEPWTGHALLSERHQNNLWCRRDANGSWHLDVTISEGDSECWVYRRDPRIRVPWADAVLRTANNISYLAPELQLLFKSKNQREKDDADAQQVIPELSISRRDRLTQFLPTIHPWHNLLSDLK